MGRVWWENWKVKSLLERPRHTWENSVNVDLKEMGWMGVDWIHLTVCRDQWQGAVMTNKPASSIQCRKFLDQLGSCWLCIVTMHYVIISMLYCKGPTVLIGLVTGKPHATSRGQQFCRVHLYNICTWHMELSVLTGFVVMVFFTLEKGLLVGHHQLCKELRHVG